MILKEITHILEDFAPLALQESYDNSGLLVGSPFLEIKGILLSTDITEEVVQEAIEGGYNLVIAHHPIIFGTLKKLNGKNYVERTVIKALKNDIALYASHTNLDAVQGGVNSKICEKLKLNNCKVLEPQKKALFKLTTFVPVNEAERVRLAMFEAGAGHIGNYDFCSYNSVGEGSFRALENTNPYVGKQGKIHFEKETKIETVLPKHLLNNVLNALKKVHPYEEVAYDIYPLENKNSQIGIGMIGELENPINELAFLKILKSTFNAGLVRYTKLLNRKIKKVAVCGGSGAFLLNRAIAAKADVYVTADFKYHQFFDTEEKIIIADIGHYESEQFTKEIFYELLTKIFPNFAIQLSKINTNPVNYL